MAEATDQTAAYATGFAIILGALLLSAAIYFSVGGLTQAIVSKNFEVKVEGGAAAQQPSAQQPTPSAPTAPTAPAAPAKVGIDLAGQPARGGGANAQVTVVEFSDFQCPYCSKAAPNVKQVEDKYGNKVNLVFVNFPLSFHPNAQKAAEAGECALDQGKFWEMHDKMFADQNALSVDQLKASAKAIGLDTAKFNTCLDSGAKASHVASDESKGQAVGVGGTPSFMIYMPTKNDAKLSAINTAVAKLNSQYPGVSAEAIEVANGGYGAFFAGALPADAFSTVIDSMTN